MVRPHYAGIINGRVLCQIGRRLRCRYDGHYRGTRRGAGSGGRLLFLGVIFAPVGGVL